MERYNGFLDLDKYFKNLHNNSWFTFLFQAKKYIKVYDRYRGQYWINLNNQEYFFKPTDNPYSELVAYRCAKYLEINATPYDLAVFTDKKGVISQNFRKENCSYISGCTVLNDFIKNPDNVAYLRLMGFRGRKKYLLSWKYINNLEVISQAIEYKYKDQNKNYKEAIYKMVVYFIFNILLCQNDGMAPNWELEENENKISLAPIYDNEMCFASKNKGINMSNLSTNFNDAKLSNEKKLDEFLTVSSKEFVELFLEKYESLSVDIFTKIIQSVENSIDNYIPSEVKENIMASFIENREKLEEVLNKHNLIRTRKKC